MAISKKAAAQLIYSEMTASGHPRKEIIERMVTEAGLTKAGAATYYTNFKRPPNSKSVATPALIESVVVMGEPDAPSV